MFAVTPILFDLDEKLQVAAMPEQFFNIMSRPHTDVFQVLGAVANDDFLLRPALDENRAVNAREIGAHVFPFLRDHCGDVRKFFAGCLQNLLTHNFGC